MKKSFSNSNNIKAQAGFSVIELMVSVAILAVITSVVLVFLNSSMKLSDLNNARSEVTSSLNLAMELITTELYSAGSIGVDTDGSQSICAKSDLTPAFQADDLTTTRNHKFTIRYCDPYSRAAKVVSYKLNKDTNNNNLSTLYRNERPVGQTGSFQPSIAGIVGLELEFFCKPSTNCDPTSIGFLEVNLLSIVVKVAAQSTFLIKSAKQETYSFGLVGDAEEVTAQKGYLYDYSEQLVRPVNLIANQ